MPSKGAVQNAEHIATIREMLNSILSEAKKTNGRVRVLEKFMWACIGGLILVSAMTPLLIKLTFF